MEHDFFGKPVPTFPDHALPRGDQAAMGQAGHDLWRDRFRLYTRRIVGLASNPDAGLEAFDRERAVMGQAMLDLEARAAAADHGRCDRDLVAEPGRQQESGPRLDQRVAGKIVGLEILDLLHAEGALDQHRGRHVEKLEIAGEEDYPRRVAVAPFDPGFAGEGKHDRDQKIRDQGSDSQVSDIRASDTQGSSISQVILIPDA